MKSMHVKLLSNTVNFVKEGCIHLKVHIFVCSICHICLKIIWYETSGNNWQQKRNFTYFHILLYNTNIGYTHDCLYLLFS